MIPLAEAEERRDRIAELTRQGLPVAIIAEKLGVTTRTVNRARIARGCATPMPPRMTDDELATARAMLEDGASYSEVARTLGRAPRNIVRRFPGYGWDQHQGGQHGMAVRMMTLLERKLAI